jgi:predicted Zn-dependent protease
LDIKILPAIDIESSALDPNRQQFVAERLIAEAEQKYSRFAARPGVALISFTEEDMYPVSVDWGWVFGFHIGRSDVISTARFDEPFDGSPAGQAAVLSRLRRVTGRYPAFLHYHLPPNNNPKSLLYYSVMSVEELDALPEDF